VTRVAAPEDAALALDRKREQTEHDERHVEDGRPDERGRDYRPGADSGDAHGRTGAT